MRDAQGYPARRSEGLVRRGIGALVVGVAVALAVCGAVGVWLRDVHRGWRVYRELHRNESHRG